MVQVLLDRGADIEATNRSGGTSLHYAAYEGRADTVKVRQTVHRLVRKSLFGVDPPRPRRRC